MLERRDRHDQVEPAEAAKVEHVAVEHPRSLFVLVDHQVLLRAVVRQHVADLEHPVGSVLVDERLRHRHLDRALGQPRELVAVVQIAIALTVELEVAALRHGLAAAHR